MKRVIFLVILLLLSVCIGLWIHENPGSLLIVLNHWTIEMPVWFSLLGLFIGYFVFFILLRILTVVISLKQWLGRIKRHWKKKHAQLNTRRGLIEFGEGNWKKAEYHLIKAVPAGNALLLNYLTAARAAQELGSSERRDEYLREAQRTNPDAKIAIELTQAQLQIVSEQWEQALATLNHLQSLSPYHPYVMKLLVKVYLLLKDWTKLEQWLPHIRRKKIMNEKDFLRLENEVYAGLLEQRSKQVNLDVLESIWADFPKHIRRTSDMLALYILKLIEYQAFEIAEAQCREALKYEWNDLLVALYGQCESSNVEEQLRFSEHYLKYYANNAYLLLTLGRVCRRCQLWGKSKDYFLKSAHIQPEAETYAELAKLSEQLHESESATTYYKKSLALAMAKNQAIKKESLPQWDDFYYLVGKIVF